MSLNSIPVFNQRLAADERLRIVDGDLIVEKNSVRSSTSAWTQFWTRGEYSQATILKKMGKLYKAAKKEKCDSIDAFVDNYRTLVTRAQQQNEKYENVDCIVRFFQAKSYIDCTSAETKLADFSIAHLKLTIKKDLSKYNLTPDELIWLEDALLDFLEHLAEYLVKHSAGTPLLDIRYNPYLFELDQFRNDVRDNPSIPKPDFFSKIHTLTSPAKECWEKWSKEPEQLLRKYCVIINAPQGSIPREDPWIFIDNTSNYYDGKFETHYHDDGANFFKCLLENKPWPHSMSVS